jgi:hypothetical protein
MLHLVGASSSRFIPPMITMPMEIGSTSSLGSSGLGIDEGSRFFEVALCRKLKDLVSLRGRDVVAKRYHWF